MRCSCVGGTSGCTMYTSRCRQLAWSCAWRQSLLNLVISTEDSGTSRSSQMALASGRCAEPLKTTTLLSGTGPPRGAGPGGRPQSNPPMQSGDSHRSPGVSVSPPVTSCWTRVGTRHLPGTRRPDHLDEDPHETHLHPDHRRCVVSLPPAGHGPD